MELNSINLIGGFMLGVQCEELDDDIYVIVALGFLEIILVW